MSVNKDRYKKAINNKEYRVMYLNDLYPPYWEEGHLKRKNGLYGQEYREYRSWKYNRKTQYKL
jgi:hypothetical protein